MNDTLALLKRIGADGRKDLLEKWLRGQKKLVADYNNDPRNQYTKPRQAFIDLLVYGFFSPYKCEVWHHLATIDMPVRKEFEGRYDDLLASVR